MTSRPSIDSATAKQAHQPLAGAAPDVVEQAVVDASRRCAAPSMRGAAPADRRVDAGRAVGGPGCATLQASSGLGFRTRAR